MRISFNSLFVFVLFFSACTDKEKSDSTSSLPRSTKEFKGKVHFKFKNKENTKWLARSGDFKVDREQISQLPAIKAFAQKRNDLLFVLAYKQFVQNSEGPISELAFSFPKVSRDPKSILVQYGIKLQPSLKLSFGAFSAKKGIARVGTRYVQEDEIEKNNYIWGSYATELFNYQLFKIDEILKQKYIVAEAEKLGISRQQYLETYIFKELVKDISDIDVQEYMKKYSMTNTDKNRQMARQRLLDFRKKRGMDYILEKYVMELPIEVNLDPPQFKLDTKYEWTPHLGVDSHEIDLALFADPKNSNTKSLVEGLRELVKNYPPVKLYYRPFFPAKDTFNSITSQMHFCVWMNHNNKFWDYFQETLGDFRERTEAVLYEKAKDLNLEVEPLKKCLISQKYKEIVDYHLKYADYLGIKGSPVLFVGGEVLYGGIQLKQIKKIIQRRLEIPAAGHW